MPFDAATKFVKTYVTNRADQLRNVKRLQWALQGTTAVPALLDTTFGRQAENDAWTKATTGTTYTSQTKLIGIRAKIGWMCGCVRDLRTQFAAAADSRPRMAADQLRYEILRLRWGANGLDKFVELTKGKAGN